MGVPDFPQDENRTVGIRVVRITEKSSHLLRSNICLQTRFFNSSTLLLYRDVDRCLGGVLVEFNYIIFISLVFSQGRCVQTISNYLDSDCSVADDPAVAVIDGTYVLPGGSVATSLG